MILTQVYADARDFIISKKRLLPESKQSIKQGGFGKVVKQKLIVSTYTILSEGPKFRETLYRNFYT